MWILRIGPMPDVSWALLGRKPLLIGGGESREQKAVIWSHFGFWGQNSSGSLPISNDARSLENTWLNGRRNNKPRNDDDDGD